ncbi:spermidine/putrescine ABC transporter permease [Ktedonobacter sp. SOSP1-85]|uniref:ABC transporter permease n=1 Tax=Ktedonobacter sp. SOSP1-85 TaxID=2778367 RepID=UPI001915430F|nr:ABC transporter permease subunit [Ktedonobacter sp. SOSP1-85]GHO78387.1 spermidine/putrescine ABC transporter permease [Ktedonobacter sp. SOSP1-85]
MKQQQAKRFSLALDKIILFLVMLYLIIPLGATLVFGLNDGSRFNLGVLTQVFSDGDFAKTLLLSLGLAIASTLIAVILITPTVYWMQLRLPQARPLLEFLSLLPFAVPPIVLSLGYLEVFGDSHTWIDVLSLGLVPMLSNEPFTIANTPQLLIFAYVVIALPFIYRPIDNSLRALNTRVLSEAASNLGCGWWRTFLTIILPNIWPGVISAALLTFSTAMGEFTIAVLSGIYTFPVYLNQIGQGNAHQAALLTIMSFLITLLCVLGILVLVRSRAQGKGQTVEIGGGR